GRTEFIPFGPGDRKGMNSDLRAPGTDNSCQGGPMRDDRVVSVLVVAAALAVAAVSARGYVGGWNDGSRLATVECLVDYHTLAIDRSVFQPGTADKLLVAGHFYSDKSPVPAVLLAGVYQLWRWCGGPPAA